MECPICGLWTSADPDTGHDADEICPRCASYGWVYAGDGSIINDGSVPPMPAERPAKPTLTEDVCEAISNVDAAIAALEHMVVERSR